MQQLELFDDEDDFIILEMEKFISEIEIQIQKMDEQERFFIENNAFDWTLEFPQLCDKDGNWEGFDVVIGNPPYINIQEISSDSKKYFSKNYKTATGRFDIYSLFIERSMNLIKLQGTFGFIVPGKFLNNKQFVTARKLICNNHHSVNISEIVDKVFEEAQVNSVIVIYYFEPEKLTYNAKRITKTEIFEISSIPIQSILQDKEIIFKIDINETNENLLKKIESDCFKIKEIGEVKDGIVAGLLKDILFIDTIQNENCYPIYFGKNVKRYNILESTIFIDYRIDYMKIQENLRKKGNEPGLRMRKPEIFEREKILTRFVAKEIIATFDDKKRYYEHTLHGTYISDKRFKTKYILALFNSKLFKFYYHRKFSFGGNIFPQVRIASIENLPIKIIDLKQQDNIIKIVDKILIEKQQNVNSDTSKLENQIDELIYKIYNLTPDEINYIENATA
jgi:hypothetical protein